MFYSLWSHGNCFTTSSSLYAELGKPNLNCSPTLNAETWSMRLIFSSHSWNCSPFLLPICTGIFPRSLALASTTTTADPGRVLPPHRSCFFTSSCRWEALGTYTALPKIEMSVFIRTPTKSEPDHQWLVPWMWILLAVNLFTHPVTERVFFLCIWR